MEFYRRQAPKGQESGGGGGNKPPKNPETPQLKNKEVKGQYSQEAKEYFRSLKSELDILLQWLLSKRVEYKNILNLQNESPAEFQNSKNALWQSYKDEVLPELKRIRTQRQVPQGREVASINRHLDQRFNLLHHENQKLLASKKLIAKERDQLLKSIAPKTPSEIYTLNVTIPDLAAKFEKSLQQFWLAENFKENNDTNPFRLDIWLSKLHNAVNEIGDFLNSN